MPKILVDICTQIDLCVKSGKASLMDQQTLDLCEEVVNYAVKKNILIIGAVESNSFTSKYCVKGTVGWLKPNETSVKRCLFIPNVKLTETEKLDTFIPNSQGIYFETTIPLYSNNTLFSNPNVLSYIDELYERSDLETEYVVFGVNNRGSIKNTVEDIILYASNDPIGLSVAVLFDACSFESQELKQAVMSSIGDFAKAHGVTIRFISTAKFVNE